MKATDGLRSILKNCVKAPSEQYEDEAKIVLGLIDALTDEEVTALFMKQLKEPIQKG